MGSTFNDIATVVKTAFETEFAVEGFKLSFDHLHEAMGRDRVAVGIAPVEERASASRRVIAEHTLEVRFFDLWTDEVRPDTIVNPSKITAYAERFKRCLLAVNSPGTQMSWFFDVERIQFPNDPTGNKTRFIATIRAVGNNSSIVETTG